MALLLADKLPSLAREIILAASFLQAFALAFVVVTLPSLINCVVKPLKSAFLWSAGLLNNGILSWCLIILKNFKLRFCFVE